MYYPDLGKICQGGCGPNIRVIGWLDNKHPFTKGPVSEEFLEALRENLVKPQQYISYKGKHLCELCSKASNHYQLYIPSEKFLYIAPAMILHYVEVHQYQPPQEFIEAVLKCPVQKSDEYLQAIEPFMPLEDPNGLIMYKYLEKEPPPEPAALKLSDVESSEFIELLENFPHSASSEQTDSRYVIELDE